MRPERSEESLTVTGGGGGRNAHTFHQTASARVSVSDPALALALARTPSTIRRRNSRCGPFSLSCENSGLGIGHEEDMPRLSIRPSARVTSGVGGGFLGTGEVSRRSRVGTALRAVRRASFSGAAGFGERPRPACWFAASRRDELPAACGVDGARVRHSTRQKVREVGTTSPARGTRALPGTRRLASHPRDQAPAWSRTCP